MAWRPVLSRPPRRFHPSIASTSILPASAECRAYDTRRQPPVACARFWRSIRKKAIPIGMLASSGGLFLYQQQKQHRQRRRDLQSSILSSENEVNTEPLEASMSDDDSSVVLDFRDDFSDACSISSAGISSVNGSSRAATPFDALHGDFLELGANGSVADNEVHSPMLSRSGSNCSDDDSSQTARSRLWMEHLQASSCHRVPLEVLVNLRGELTPTLIKDCIAVLKGAGIVPADVQITNDTAQRLAWLASVAASTIVPTYRNSLPLLLLPLLHSGMPNAAILSCFERLVWTRLGPFFSTSGSVRAKIACCGRLLLLYHDPLSLGHLCRCRIEVDLIIEGWLAAMCGWDSSCDACALLWDYALADDSCFVLLAFCVVAIMSMRHMITTGSPSDVQSTVNAFALKDVATTRQLVERCRCLVDATPDAIKFTVDRVWKAADSASSGQVLLPIRVLSGTDVASSFCVPAEAVVSSLKNCRSGLSAPVFAAIDTRSAAAFGRRRLPTALHVPVLAEDTGLILHPPVNHITCMRQAIEKLMPLNGKRHLCLIMTSSYDDAPQDERAGIIRLITLMRRRGVRYVSIVHGGQAAIDAAVLKLFPEWTDDATVSVQAESKTGPIMDHSVPSTTRDDSSVALNTHDDLDEYLFEMDKDSVSGSGFSFVDGSNLPVHSGLNSRHRISKDSASASFVSAAEAVESAAVVQSEDLKSNLDQLSVSAVRLRLLRRAPQVSVYLETGDVPCSDLDAVVNAISMRSRGGGSGSIEALRLHAAMHINACLVPHCPSIALAELTAVVAADANDWDSVCTLAQLILQVPSQPPGIGRDGLARAADRARVLLSFIASCGHPRACALLGSLERVHGSVDKGISLLEQAAEKGICDAHLELGLHFHSKDPRAQGGGGLTNAEQCMRWFKSAAALGSPRAFFFCGLMHCDSKWDQPQDIVLAGMFFIIGRALGDPSATKAMNQLMQKTQKELHQQMFDLAEAWAARLIQPLEAEHQQAVSVMISALAFLQKP